MSSAGAPGESRRRRTRPWFPALAVTAMMLTALAVTSEGTTSPGTPGRWAGPNLWTNGEVDASFAFSVPGVTMGSSANPGAYDMYAGVRAVSELSPEGSPVATAWFNGSSWNIGNLTSSARVAVLYTGNVPVQGSGTPGARVAVSVGFSIPPVASSSDGFTSIGVTVTVNHWPWVHSTDELAMLFPLWPSNASESHLASSAGGASIDCLSNDTGAVLEYLAWNSTGQTIPSSGDTRELPAQANVTFASPRALVWVRFAPTGSEYPGLAYAATVGVFAPSGTPGPSMSLDVGILAAAGSVIVLLAVWMRSLRNHVPSLLH